MDYTAIDARSPELLVLERPYATHCWFCAVTQHRERKQKPNKRTVEHAKKLAGHHNREFTLLAG